MSKTRMAAALLLLLATATASASDKDHNFGMGVSFWGIGDSYDNEFLRLSYEFKPSDRFWGIRPLVALSANTSSDYYVSLGWVKDLPLRNKWSWGFGQEYGYWNGDDHLGYDIEFYSRLFVDYGLSASSYLRAEFGHISNAGFGDHNPGSEILTLSYTKSF